MKEKEVEVFLEGYNKDYLSYGHLYFNGFRYHWTETSTEDKADVKIENWNLSDEQYKLCKEEVIISILF